MSQATTTPAQPPNTPTPRTSRRIVGLFCAALGFAAILAAAGATWLVSHPGLWRAYTDGRSIYVRDGDPDLRPITWAPAQPIEAVNGATTHLDGGALSEQGTILVFAAKAPDGDDLDLYTSRFNGVTWSRPRPIIWLNTNADEIAPTLGAGGRALFFSSDRKGGMGGMDLYVSWWDGTRWTHAFNLGSRVNSEFDELDPCLAPDGQTLYFASNRPKTDVSAEQRRALWEQTVAQHKYGDLDIFIAEGVSIPSRSNPLRDAAFRKAMIAQLGGSPETEAAVLKGLQWLAKAQEPDGHWDMAKHGGAKGQDIAGTALAVLSYLGYGVQYTEQSEFQEPVYRAVRWLKGRAIQSDGNFSRGVSQGMYGQGMATIALAEAYAVTGDQTLRQPLEKAVKIIVDAQNRQTGGWRYDSRPPPVGDMSVTGWQVMALYSARKAGIAVPDETMRLAERWLGSVAVGQGAYGYQQNRKSARPAMTAEGMFVRQLLGARRGDPRQQQTADWLMQHLPGGGGDFYYWYYGCLSLYQQQGAAWTQWNDAIKPVLLKLQNPSGTWQDQRYKQFGQVGSTALGALCLEVYYRYLWRLDQETDPVVEANKKLGRAPIVFPKEPAELLAQRLPALSSPATDRGVRFTHRGDFVYFTSDRPGGRGGMDVYRARIIQDEIQPIENAGPRINTPADDVAPSPACHGSLLLLASGKATESKTTEGKATGDGTGFRLVTHTARELHAVTSGWRAWLARCWFYGLLILLGTLLVLLSILSIVAMSRGGGSGGAWTLTFVFVVLMAGWVGLALRVWTHSQAWLRYTDGAGLTLPAGDVSLRQVIWELALQMDVQANRRPNLLAVAASPRGRVVVFSRQLPTEETADLFTMRYEAGQWSEPTALATLNTSAEETAPALSADGSVLWFQSNRGGGEGGFDLYQSHWNGKTWTAPTNLGPAVNTPADECDPCPAPDGKSLYFASNRPIANGDGLANFDIYRLAGPGAAPAGPPASAQVSRVEGLCSGADDRAPAFTPNGDFLYFSSNRPGGAGGMDLYVAPVRHGQPGQPINAGSRVNSAANDLSPAPVSHGFELRMISDRVFNTRRPSLLYVQAAPEVSAHVDGKAWQWMIRSKWWLAALGLGVALLIGLLVWYYRWGRYGRQGMLVRCMTISVLLHAIFLVILSVWMIRQEIQQGTDGPLEIAVDANALASERLAQDIRETVSETSNTPEMMHIESILSDQALPDFEPVHPQAPTIVDTEFAIDRSPVRPEVREVKIAEPIHLPRPQPLTQQKISLQFKPTDLHLEVRPPEAKTATEPSKPVEVAIAPVKTVERISQAAELVRPTSGQPEERGSQIAEGALPEVSGSEAVTVASAPPVARAVPQLRGPGQKLPSRIPLFTPDPATWLGSEKGKGTGAGSGANRLNPYLGRQNKEALARYGGGGDDTERAISHALEWFKKIQEPDGRWSLQKQGGVAGHDNAATGFVMLCYMGWNIRHNADDTYGYRPVMAKAVQWLVGRVGKDGDLTGGANNGMYDQGIATTALAEAYGLSKDPALKEPLERAVQFILRGQNKTAGGWRYRPGSADCDTSVVGWQLMALSSARLAGLEVPEKNLQLAELWLRRVSSGPHGGRYAYQDNRKPTPTMTAEAMFCRQLLGTATTDDRQAGSVEYLRTHLPNPRNVNYYYWYYGTLALHQHQGEVWPKWNKQMKEVLLTSQVTEGDDAGSWPAVGQWTRNRGGKIMATAMSALSLEVYYRYLPMYTVSAPPQTPPAKP